VAGPDRRRRRRAGLRQHAPGSCRHRAVLRQVPPGA
jgi:hypothetical protein